MTKEIWKRLLLTVIIGLLLSCFVSVCAKERVVVIPDSELLTPHPTDEGKVCMDKGYLLRIYDELETCQ